MAMKEGMARKRRGRDSGEQERLTTDAERQKAIDAWVPKTELGKKVKNGELGSLDELFETGHRIMEPEIADVLVPELMEKMVDFKKTAKVRRAGRQFAFRVTMLIGDGISHIGIGTATNKERWPAARKALKKAKLNMVKVARGCGSWECACGTPHTVPFKVGGKSGSVRVSLMPAPRGTGLVAGDNIKDVFRFVGIKDVWCKTSGCTPTKLNFVAAAVDALANTLKTKLSEDVKRKVGK